jgi:predicted NBD/HSP70 family sugar kinase
MHDGQLTVGLDLGDRSSFYCVLNRAGEVISEERLATSPEEPPSVMRATSSQVRPQ